MRAEVFDAQDVVGSRNVWEERGDDKTDADDVKPSRGTPLFPLLAEGGVSSAGKGDKAEQKPRYIQGRLEMHSFLP